MSLIVPAWLKDYIEIRMKRLNKTLKDKRYDLRDYQRARTAARIHELQMLLDTIQQSNE